MEKFFSTVGIIVFSAAFYFIITFCSDMTVNENDCSGYVGWFTGGVLFCVVCYLWITGVKF